MSADPAEPSVPAEPAVPAPQPGSSTAMDATPNGSTARESLERSAGRAASLVGAGILVSRLVGFVRNFVFARYFGDSAAADAYNAALKIPNIVRNLLGEGTISASFIPVYSAMLGRSDEAASRRLAGAVLGILLAAASVLTIVGMLAAPLLTGLLVSEWDAEKQALTTRLVRVLFPMTGLMVLSGWCLGIQNSHRRFFISYASAALWSVAQIALLVAWGPRADDLARLAWWLAWATLAGAVLQIAAQLPEVVRLAGPLRPSLDRTAPGVRETIRNFVPVVVALGVVQLSGLVDIWLASWLPDGALASIEYARYIFLLPIGLFGISIAAASLPELAREGAASAHHALRARVDDGWLRVLFYIVPVTVVFLAFGDHIVALLYRSGEFGASETIVVSRILAAFAVGLVGFASVKLLASAHYALRDYRTPLRAGVLSLIAGTATSAALTFSLRDSLLGAAGLALGSSVAAYVNLAALAIGLRRRISLAFTGTMWRAVGRILAASLGAALVAWGAERLLGDLHFRLVAAGTLLVFGGIFIVSAHLMGSREAGRWLRAARLIR